MEAFVKVFKKDPKVRVKIDDTLDSYMRLPYKYNSEIGYDCLIQNIVLKEFLNIMGTRITDLDVELKMKISRIEYLEKKHISEK